MTWKEILELAECVSSGTDEGETLSTAEIAAFGQDLAREILQFNAAVLGGERKMPREWKRAAVHLAGYERA